MQRKKTISATDWLYYNIVERRVLHKRIFVAIVLLLAGGVSYYLYSDISFSSKIIPVVENRVYRSGQLSKASLEKAIKEKNIRTIINLRGKISGSKWYADEKSVSEKYGVKLYDIGLDSNDLPKYHKLMTITRLLQESDKPVLIHCRRGVDRTSLVSALALVLEKDPPFSQIKNQFSFRYGVVPFYRSAGPYFFSLYEEWLGKTRNLHSRHALFHWMKNEYQDSYGNLEFWIDYINGIGWEEFLINKEVRLPKNEETVYIKGWAFDAGTKEPVSALHVIFDNRISHKAEFNHSRRDVARYFGLGEKYYEFPIGWEISIKRDSLSPGCHTLSVRYFKAGSVFDIPTDAVLCL